jgi:hypothetical protein
LSSGAVQRRHPPRPALPAGEGPHQLACAQHPGSAPGEPNSDRRTRGLRPPGRSRRTVGLPGVRLMTAPWSAVIRRRPALPSARSVAHRQIRRFPQLEDRRRLARPCEAVLPPCPVVGWGAWRCVVLSQSGISRPLHDLD